MIEIFDNLFPFKSILDEMRQDDFRKLATNADGRIRNYLAIFYAFLGYER